MEHFQICLFLILPQLTTALMELNFEQNFAPDANKNTRIYGLTFHSLHHSIPTGPETFNYSTKHQIDCFHEHGDKCKFRLLDYYTSMVISRQKLHITPEEMLPRAGSEPTTMDTGVQGRQTNFAFCKCIKKLIKRKTDVQEPWTHPTLCSEFCSPWGPHCHICWPCWLGSPASSDSGSAGTSWPGRTWSATLSGSGDQTCTSQSS